MERHPKNPMRMHGCKGTVGYTHGPLSCSIEAMIASHEAVAGAKLTLGPSSAPDAGGAPAPFPRQMRATMTAIRASPPTTPPMMSPAPGPDGPGPGPGPGLGPGPGPGGPGGPGGAGGGAGEPHFGTSAGVIRRTGWRAAMSCGLSATARYFCAIDLHFVTGWSLFASQQPES